MHLPKHLEPYDRNFVGRLIQSLPYKYRAKAVQGYDQAWQEAYEQEQNEVKKENKARFAANTRLRAFVERVQKLNNT